MVTWTISVSNSGNTSFLIASEAINPPTINSTIIRLGATP